MKMKNLAVVVLVGAAAALSLCWMGGQSEPSPNAHLINRPWVTHMPKSPRHLTHVLFLGKDNEIGATVHGTSFRHLQNLVNYKVTGDQLQMVSLQDGVRVAALARTWECDEAPGELDLCLELKLTKQGRGVVLYSASSWERKDERPAAVNRLLAIATDPAALQEAAASRAALPAAAPQPAALPEWFQTLR